MGCFGRLFSRFRSKKVEPIGQASDQPEIKNDGSIFCTTNTSSASKENVFPSTSRGAEPEVITKDSVIESLENKEQKLATEELDLDLGKYFILGYVHVDL